MTYECQICNVAITRPPSWFRGDGPFYCGKEHQGLALRLKRAYAQRARIDALIDELEKEAAR